MKLGNFDIKATASLAPMASVADKAYRIIAKQFGASYLVGELCSAKGICYNSTKSAYLLEVLEQEYPMAVQLFGDSPQFMAQAAKYASQFSPTAIDVNMGCPVPKVVSNGAGSALMRQPQLAFDIISAMVDAVDIPITVKIRKGWDENNVNAVEFAMLMEKAGASAITVHARTKVQMYNPPVDIDIIKQVKNAVSIPVIGNGGIATPIDAKEMYDKTGCDLIMVGQASFGYPWIFRDVEHYLNTGVQLPQPCIDERLNVMMEHLSLLCHFKGEKQGMREARKYAAWYFKGMHGAAKFRNQCSTLSTYNDLKHLCSEIKRNI